MLDISINMKAPRPKIHVINTAEPLLCFNGLVMRCGLELKQAGAAWEVTIPEKYRVGHEQHFAQVTERFLRFLADGRMPGWEVPNMLAKYYTTTEAYRLSHKPR